MGRCELRSVELPLRPYNVATVVEVMSSTRDALPSDQAALERAHSREWLDGVWVVDADTNADVLEVSIDLSHVRRKMGEGSVQTLQDVRRLTLQAFCEMGGVDAHRVSQDLSLRAMGRQTVWPWEKHPHGHAEESEEGMLRRALQDKALRSVRQQDTDSAHKSLFFVFLVVAVVAGLAFRQTTKGEPPALFTQ